MAYQTDAIISVHNGHKNITDSKVNGANMGPIWGRQDPGGPHVGPMNFAIWDSWQSRGNNTWLLITDAKIE